MRRSHGIAARTRMCRIDACVALAWIGGAALGATEPERTSPDALPEATVERSEDAPESDFGGESGPMSDSIDRIVESMTAEYAESYVLIDRFRGVLRDAIRAATASGVNSGTDARTLLKELEALSYDRLLAFLERRMGEEGDDRPARALECAVVSYFAGDFGRAETSLQSVLADEPENLAALDLLGYARYALGWLDGAETCFQQALSLAEKEGMYSASAHGMIAVVRSERGDHDRAIEAVRAAIKVYGGLGRTADAADSYSLIAYWEFRRGRNREAEEPAIRAVELNSQLGRTGAIARSKNELGVILTNLGEYDRAEVVLRESIAQSEKINSIEDIASACINLGILMRMRGELDGAERMSLRSFDLNAQIGRIEGLAYSMSNLGTVYEMRGEYRRARHAWTRAVEMYERAGLDRYAEDVRRWMADLPE